NQSSTRAVADGSLQAKLMSSPPSDKTVTGTSGPIPIDARNDYSLATGLAATQPAKLKQMQAVFLKEAVKYNVLPIDDRSVERFNAAIAGRPDLMGPRTSMTLYPGMTGMMENTFINLKNRSNTITAEIDVPQGGAEGVV
ncbi:hypothetical protein QTI66_39370, partial [Variovorax sp. J22R133]|nr:hypothetical protein [Variovorax sp. J22R133]